MTTNPDVAAVETRTAEPITPEVLSALSEAKDDALVVSSGTAKQGLRDARLPSTDVAAQSEPIAVSTQAIILSYKQVTTLTKKLSPEELDIKPDKSAAVYVSHTVCRDRLNDAFGPFGWRLVPLTKVMIDTAASPAVLYREFRLDVADKHGAWHAGPSAMGEQPYLAAKQFTWGDALEGCRSIALTRCCKTIGMAVDRKVAERFRRDHCVKVFVESVPEQGRDRGNISPVWRRVDAPSLQGELGICKDSPNRNGYEAPPLPYWHKDKSGEKKADAKPAAPAAAAPAAKNDNEPRITRKQAAELWREQKKSGIDEGDVVAAIRTRWHAKSSEDIRLKHYGEIMAWLKKGGD